MGPREEEARMDIKLISLRKSLPSRPGAALSGDEGHPVTVLGEGCPKREGGN